MSQDNITKNITNGSGSTVRTKMNDALRDLNSANSGTGDPVLSLDDGGFWFDLNTNDLKVKYNGVMNIMWSKNVVLGTTGTINAGADTDIVSNFGRNRLGSLASDVASLSHIDNSTLTNYGIKQNASGQTSINSASSQVVSIAQNGTQLGQFQSDDTDEFTFRLGASASITPDTFKTGISTAIGDIEVWQIEGTGQANLQMVDSGAGTDLKMVQLKQNGGFFTIRAITDAYTINKSLITFNYAGSDVIINTSGIPTSNAGLSSGDWYRDGASADADLKIK